MSSRNPSHSFLDKKSSIFNQITILRKLVKTGKLHTHKHTQPYDSTNGVNKSKGRRGSGSSRTQTFNKSAIV